MKPLMSSLDQWWNTNFPPHSFRRLVFFWLATPVIGLLVGVLRARDFSWNTLYAVTLATLVMVTIGWWLARNGYGRNVEPLEVPLLKVDPSTTVPGMPGVSSSEQPDPGSRHATAHLIRRDVAPTELAVSGLMMFAALLFSTARLYPEGAFTPRHFVISLIAAALVLLVVMTGFSLAALLLIAALMAIPLASLLYLFLYWLGGDDSFFEYWFMAFLVTGGGAVGLWWRVSDLKRKHQWAQIPLWATSLGTSLMVVIATIFAVPGGASEQQEPHVPGRNEQTASVSFGALSRDTAAGVLYQAWANNDRKQAARVAHEAATDALFSYSPAGATFHGCGEVEGGEIRCAYRTPHNLLLLGFATSGDGSYYVRWVEPRPLDFPIDLSY